MNLGGALYEGANRVDEALAHFATALRLQARFGGRRTVPRVVLGDLGRAGRSHQPPRDGVALRPDYAFAREQLARLRAAR